MRNLKKILALVLALVMSLSLMATAGAAETTAAEGTSKYQTATDVLQGLEVIRGDEGGFRYQDTITRAEVAAVLYRIATGDVKDAQASIHTGQPFTDVQANDWYTPYISYCYIAEYIKGNPNGTFEPDTNINGYATLAMILRAMGYGKNGEFEGEGWEIRTASTARQIGILDGIVDTQLSGNATRELVFEILFRAIFKDMVKFDAREPFVYPSTGENLAKKNLGLEKIDGVVTGNEYADLNSGSTLPAGKTDLQVGENEYRLNVTTDLTDIGESRTAYVKRANKASYDLVVNKLYGNDNNVRAESGEATTVSALAGTENLSLSGAEYFVNFDFGYLATSQYKLKYVMRYQNDPDPTDPDYMTAKQKAEAEEALLVNWDADFKSEVRASVTSDADPASKTGEWIVTRTINPGKIITSRDLSNMRHIFGYADLELTDKEDVNKGVTFATGEIYVNTQSTSDISDDKNYYYEKFEDEFIEFDRATAFSSTGNGEWLKIIDNDQDGFAEYVFYTWYALAETTGYNSRNEYYTYSAPGKDHSDYGWEINLSPNNDAVNYVGDYEPAVGDMVLAAYIDGKWQIEAAPMETKTIKTVNYKDKTVTTTDDDTWEESVIANWTEYPDDMLAMSNTVQYEIFFDHFGYVIAYREVQGQTKYALLSELYYTNEYNGKYIKNNTPIVEITMGEEDTTELPVSNSKDNVFDGAGRTYFNNKGVSFTDYLTRAISMLGLKDNAKNNLQAPAAWTGAVLNENDQYVYDYDANGNPVDPSATHKVTETNVAAYSLSEDGESVAVNSVSAFKFDRRGNALYYINLDEDGSFVDPSKNDKVTYDEYQRRLALVPDAQKGNVVVKNVFATDYVKLDATQDIKKGAVRYDIDQLDVSYNVYGLVPTADRPTWDGNYVNATHNTEYYIVGVDEKTGNTTATVIDGISYFTDYANVPAIDADDITAIYAVARNTTADVGKRDYWVADVIVIETKDVVQPYDSVSLIYNNPSKTTSQVRELNALDSQTTDPSVTLTPKDRTSWPNQWQPADYGFYELYETEVNEPEIVAGSIEEIPTDAAVKKGITDYNAHGIYAATVTRDVRVQAEGDYVMIHDGDNSRPSTTNTTEYKLSTGEVPVYAVWSDAPSRDNYPIWELVPDLTMDDIEAGDEIIYVKNKAGAVKYIVIANYGEARLGQPYGHIDRYDWENGWHQAPWLAAEWTKIIDEQNKAPATQNVTLNFILGAGEGVSVKYKNDPVLPETGKPNVFVLGIPEKADRFAFEATLTGGATIKAGYALNADWTVLSATQQGTTNVWDILVVNNKQTTSLADVMPVADTDVVIATANGWTAFMTEVTTAIADPATSEEDLEAISANLTAADKAIAEDFTSTEATAIDTQLAAIEEKVNPTPATSFGAIQLKASGLPEYVTDTNFKIQHAANSTTAYLNIKSDVPNALQVTVAQLESYLTTNANEAVKVVSCTQKANGTAGDKTMYASAMDKIVVTIGTCTTEVTINVTGLGTAPSFRTVTWTDADIISVKVKTNGANQAGINAGDTVTSGDKFLDGVVLEVEYDKNWYTGIGDTNGTEDNTAAATTGKSTLTIGTGDAALSLTAKATVTVTAPAGVTITSLKKVVDGATKVVKSAAVTFTVANADRYTLAVSNGSDVTPTLANGVYTIAAGDVSADVTITLTQKSDAVLKVEAATAVVNGLTLALEQATAADEAAVQAAVVAQVNAALARAEIAGLNIANAAVVVKASDGNTYAAPNADGASVTAKVTITLDKDGTNETELAAKNMTVTWKSAEFKAKADAKAAIEAVMPGEVNQADYTPASLLAHLKELAEGVTVDGVTISDVTVTKSTGDDFISGKTWTYSIAYKVAVGEAAAVNGTAVTAEVFIR